MTEQHIYLARHGETPLNADGRLRGLADPDLNATGLRQAHELAAALSHCSRPVVVSSPLTRAVHTASIVAEYLHAERRVDKRFNDRDYGPWTAKLTRDVIKEWGTVDAAPGVEPGSDVFARVWPALNECADDAAGQNQTLIVVAHDAVLKAILTHIAPTGTVFEIATGSFQALRRDQTVWHLDDVNQLPNK